MIGGSEQTPCRSPGPSILGLKSDGGHLDPWNIRLAHVLCNQQDYGWRMRIRRMLEKGMSLEEIAERLNDKGVRMPHGRGEWSAITVRKAFVS